MRQSPQATHGEPKPASASFKLRIAPDVHRVLLGCIACGLGLFGDGLKALAVYVGRSKVDLLVA